MKDSMLDYDPLFPEPEFFSSELSVPVSLQFCCRVIEQLKVTKKHNLRSVELSMDNIGFRQVLSLKDRTNFDRNKVVIGLNRTSDRPFMIVKTWDDQKLWSRDYDSRSDRTIEKIIDDALNVILNKTEGISEILPVR